jgi:hypothetical protein
MESALETAQPPANAGTMAIPFTHPIYSLFSMCCGRQYSETPLTIFGEGLKTSCLRYTKILRVTLYRCFFTLIGKYARRITSSSLKPVYVTITGKFIPEIITMHTRHHINITHIRNRTGRNPRYGRTQTCFKC